MYVVQYLILNVIEINEINIIYNIFRWWYLIVLLYVVIIWDGILRGYLKSKKNITILVIFIVGILCSKVLRDSLLPLYINIIPTAMIFYIMGYLTNHYKLLECKKISINILDLVILLFMVIISQNNTPVLMYENSYGNYTLFLIAAILGIYLTIKLSNKFNNNKILSICGKNSIIIYVMHFCIVQSMRGITIRVFVNQSEICISIIFFILSSLILVPITYLYNKHFLFLFGKRNVKSIESLNN